MGHASAAASLPPELIIAGRYRVGRLLGQGGMGAVYAALDTSTGKTVALKRLAHDASPATAALFDREYHTLAGLRHPCIVEVYEYGRDADGVFYTMELIDGVDLSKQAPMPWRDACRDLRDAASILGVLHARQLLHRDLSPRNLLRSRSGRLKLIDFGALASFGPSNDVVGTPPFVAPEALRSAPLDQRTDLFALGALAYWLVTGIHAYAARHLAELPALWQTELVPPSELNSLLGVKELEAIPPEVDALIAALLRIDPDERLDSTAELIDRLNAVAGLEPESHEMAVQGYLDSKAFVGRVREKERALSLLAQAEQGNAQTLLIEGDAGVGRTRFLQELVVMTRLAGALPLSLDQNVGSKPYGVASQVVLELLRSLPEQTRRAANDNRTLLSELSKEVRVELHVPESSTAPYGAAELRVRLLAALRDLVLAMSKDRLLAILVDDVQAIDEESQALLTSLAHAEPGHKLLLVVTLGRDARRETSSALTSLRGQATRTRLLPLTAAETLELLRSVFGQAPYLSRLAERLHRASEGNPAYCLELAAHLVQTGVAFYQEGAWSLPVELSPESLPESRQAAQVARLDRLTIEARELARSLSVPHSSVLTLGQCFAVSGRPPHEVHDLLRELEREDVLRASGETFRFLHGDVQQALYEELAPHGRALAHAALAEELQAASRGDVLDTMRACVHFLRAGETKRAFVCQRSSVQYFVTGDLRLLHKAAPLIEEAYLLHRERGQDKYGYAGLLGLLAISGYFADRRYATRYGDLAIATLQDVLRMDLARRLQRFLGARAAILVALVVAGVSLRMRSNRAPTLKQAVRQLMGAGAALSGTFATCIDPESVSRYVDVLRPFTVLGKNHAATMTYRFACNAQSNVQDHPASTNTLVSSFIARMESPQPIAELPDGVKVNYTAGAVFMLGVVKSWQDGPECLEVADKLERYSPLHAMNADYLRGSYYAGQGDLVRADYYRQRLEVHAVQLGSAWQVETWAPGDAIKVALRTHDAGRAKRAVQELGRLSTALPSLVRTERHARGTYLVLRGKYEQALGMLEDDEAPCSIAGWARVRGVLALANNELGRHARAKEVCLHALSFLTPEDLTYVVMNLNVQVELALAEAGLGNFVAAREQLDRLLERNAPHQSPITLGALHLAYARVALRERDYGTARRHLAEVETRYRATGVATLIALIAPLRQQIDRGENPRAPTPDADPRIDRTQHVMVRVQLMLSGQGGALVTERANKGLQVALELSSADEGFIVLAEHRGERVAHLGSQAPSAELVRWAEQNMLDAGVDEQTVMTEEVHSEIDSNYKVVGQMRYCVVPLWARQAREDRVVAALVLGFDDRVPKIPDPNVMRAIAMHLVDSEQT